MGQPNILGLVSDPEFQSMNSADQQATLAHLDAEFGNLSQDDFGATVTALQRRALATGVNRPQAAGSGVNVDYPTDTNPLGSKVPRSIQRAPDWVGEAVGGAALGGAAAAPLVAVNPMTIAGPAVKYGVLPAAGYKSLKWLTGLGGE